MALEKKLPLATGWADFLLGAYYYYEGRYAEGVRQEQSVIEQADRLNAPLLRANGQKMVAWMYIEMGKEQEALNLFFAAMPVFKKFRFEDLQMNVGIGYYGIATAYYYLKNYPLALVYYDSALNATPSLDAREMALTLADRAAVKRDHFARANDALPDNEKSVTLLQRFPLQVDAQAYVDAELALTYARLGQLAAARAWALRAYRLYEKIPFVKRYVSVNSALSETFFLVGDYAQAFQLERETRALEDSIYAWRKIQVVEEMRVRYETEKKNREIELLNLQRATQQSVIIRNQTAVGLLLGFLVILLALGYFFYRKREQYHKRIRELEATEQVRLEKERISKDLHDSLGSQLSTISFGLQRAARETNYGPLQTIQTLTDGVTAELRDFIWANSRGFLTIEDLEQRINTLFLQVRQTNQPITLELDLEETIREVELSPELGVQVYRIVQESVQNTLKYARASRLVIRLNYVNEQIRLEITDDGIGFEWPLKDQKEHFGISNMKRRAIHLNGSFELKTAPGTGTRIFVTVPNRLR